MAEFPAAGKGVRMGVLGPSVEMEGSGTKVQEGRLCLSQLVLYSVLFLLPRRITVQRLTVDV